MTTPPDPTGESTPPPEMPGPEDSAPGISILGSSDQLYPHQQLFLPGLTEEESGDLPDLAELTSPDRPLGELQDPSIAVSTVPMLTVGQAPGVTAELDSPWPRAGEVAATSTTAMAFVCQPDPGRGAMQLIGRNMPNVPAQITRRVGDGLATVIRSGEFTITSGGFTLTDNEAPFGTPLTYRLSLQGYNRTIQKNLILTPNATRGVGTWQTPGGNPRTVTQVNDPGGFGGKAIQVTKPASGTDPTIVQVAIGDLPAGTGHMVVGRFKFMPLNVQQWSDILAQGAWSVQKAKANWAAVLGVVDASEVAKYTLLQFRVLSNGVEKVPWTTLINPGVAKAETWVNFSAYFNTTAALPTAGLRLQFRHGATTKELGITWLFDQVGITTAQDRAAHDTIYYFDGDTVPPPTASAAAQALFLGGDVWQSNSTDQKYQWDGTADNSTSSYLGPSTAFTETTCMLAGPPSTNDACQPVYLDDPVSPQLGQWFSLMNLATLSYGARQNIYDVIDRADPVAVSNVRRWASGTMTLMTRTLAERDIAVKMFASGRILFYRNPNPLYPETDWYLAIGDVREIRTLADHRRPERTWEIPFVRVERPSGLIDSITGRTWQQVITEDQTWGGVKTRHTDWLAVINDPVST